MRRLLRTGTTLQIIAIVGACLMMAYGLSTTIWLYFDMRPGPPPEFLKQVSQIGLTIRLLEMFPVENHPAILAATAGRGIMFQEGAGARPALDAFSEHHALGLSDALEDDPDLSRRVYLVGRSLLAHEQGDAFSVLVRLASPPDGWLLCQFISVDIRRKVPLRWLSPSGVASFIVTPILIGLISFWAVRGIAGPLVRLARATNSLNLLEDPVPVREEGTFEVRQVARAFNTALLRIQRFVLERTQMLAAISHDLRTPLTRLKLRVELIDDPDISLKMLADIRTMESMISSALAFIRDEAAHEAPEQVDVAVLLQTICDEFADAGWYVCYEGPSHCSAFCRPQALQRALNNLLENAVKFGVAATARLEANVSSITIAIDDDGPGISDEQKEAMFKPFVRGDLARNNPEGVGLGLSIVKAIVQSHSGTIELLDRVPHGLCVRLSLPVNL